ncbi:hypothetical protein BGZ99_002715 [Dissophora globulifera]|uniref:Uncharacterized protein n=1 Tax=Dissophora globulifera TaxID=979702 RepID=A0A9P6UXD8_9FUNG|nr:hypothetical protein BGZ99_002715 [Dissophora globulifera]
MGAATDVAPRTSMERHLMDRDREGQLHLETRRQQAVLDLLGHRASFLSTITPPSTNPSSAASSLFHEPLSSSVDNHDVDVANDGVHTSSLPTIPATPMSLATSSSSAAHIPSVTATFLALAPPLQSIAPIIKRTRQGSASTQGRAAPVEQDRPMLPILPSSLEYQLTASLLNFSPAPASPLAEGSRPRSKPRQPKTRRSTIGSDTRIDTHGAGHRHTRSKDRIVGGYIARAPWPIGTTLHELTPTSLPSSAPPTPTGARQGTLNSYQHLFRAPEVDASKSQHPLVANVSLSPVTPSLPLPPLPPTSSRHLIAHYFPGSLPPPPARGRSLSALKVSGIGSPPLKTPTFGPAPNTYEDSYKPSMPFPSALFPHRSSANASPCSAADTPIHDDSEQSHSSDQASPSTSALGLSVSSTSNSKVQQQSPTEVTMGFLAENGNRPLLHNHQHTNHPYRNQRVNNFLAHNSSDMNHIGHHADVSLSTAEDNMTPATTITIFPPPPPPSAASPSSGYSSRQYSGTTATPSPIYPRGLMPDSILPIPEHHPAVARIQQKPAVPYIRELVPGEDVDGANGGMSSTNTSRDLQIVVEEITGRMRTNRTSFDPWPYDASKSSWDAKPLPSVRREKGNQYWVFRDRDGIVPGPILFLLGYVCPILWWVGSVFPVIEHPDTVAAAAIAAERAAHAAGAAPTSENDERASSDLRDHPMIQWMQRPLKSIKTSAAVNAKPRPSGLIATLQIVRIDQNNVDDNDDEVLGSDHNVSAIHVPAPLPLPLPAMPQATPDTHGPWSGEDRTAALFEQRMEHDRLVLRYELDLRWKRINMIWAIGSFVLAVAITAFVIAFP